MVRPIRNDCEKLDMLLAQQVIGAYPHDHKARQDVGPADNMKKHLPGEGLGDYCQEVVQFSPPVPENKTHRVLHPGIGDENPQG